MKIVVIDWVDSVRASDWVLMEDVDEKPVNCTSVGFLLKETDDYITIAQNYGLEPEQICNLITIPKCSIRNIREIKDRYTFKPSDEQMEALEDAIRYGEEENIGILSLLYNDLKKLMEE